MRLQSHVQDEAPRAQTAQPRFRWRIASAFAAVIVILGLVSYLNQGVRRAYYGTLCAVAALAMIVRYRRERALVSNRLLVDAFVTDWGKPLRSRSRFVDFFLARLSGNIPVMKYSFVAFDQKTYTGETGWGALGLF